MNAVLALSSCVPVSFNLPHETLLFRKALTDLSVSGPSHLCTFFIYLFFFMYSTLMQSKKQSGQIAKRLMWRLPTTKRTS